jgi:hypothetical protein
VNGDDPGGATEHLRVLFAREYWRCVGKAEEARQAAETNRRATAGYESDLEKWNARAAELLEQLGGEIPENITPGDYAERMEIAVPMEGA